MPKVKIISIKDVKSGTKDGRHWQKTIFEGLVDNNQKLTMTTFDYIETGKVYTGQIQYRDYKGSTYCEFKVNKDKETEQKETPTPSIDDLERIKSILIQSDIRAASIILAPILRNYSGTPSDEEIEKLLLNITRIVKKVRLTLRPEYEEVF